LEQTDHRVDRRWQALTLEPPRAKVPDLPQKALGGPRVLDNPPSAVKRQDARNAIAIHFRQRLSAERRRFKTGAQVRGKPLDERDLAVIEVWAAAFPGELSAAPRSPANGEGAPHFVVESPWTKEFSVPQGALELAAGAFGEQRHRPPVPHHPVNGVHLVLEHDVFEEEAHLSVLQSFRHHVGRQSTQRVCSEEAVPLERHDASQDLGRFEPQRLRIEPCIAETLDLIEGSFFQRRNSFHYRHTP
jgi:hypothetical protein